MNEMTKKYIEIPEMNEYKAVSLGFFTRQGGISSPPFDSLNVDSKNGDTVTNIERNREIIAQEINIQPSNILTVNQVHSAETLIIDHFIKDTETYREKEFDSIITDQHGITIGVLTADCVPVALFDQSNLVIGIVHSGWHGTYISIIDKVIHRMKKRYKTRAENIVAAIGPAIKSCCYEIGPKLARNFQRFFMSWKEWLFLKEGKWFLDLQLVIENQLKDLGVKKEKIFRVDQCTSCNPKLFFSARRDKKTGRQLSFIRLV